MNTLSPRIVASINLLVNELRLIPADRLEFKYKPEKWSIKEIMGHLTDSAIINIQRFTEIPQTTGVYEVKPYDQDYLVKINDYQKRDMNELITLWQSLNMQLCIILDNISEDDLLKKVRVNDKEKNLEWLMSDYVAHMEHHIKQIFATKYSKLPEQNHISMKNAQSRLDEVESEFVKMLESGEIEVEFYKPDKIDKQQPHEKDEIYFVASGSGKFILEEKKYNIRQNDVLYVPAGKKHKFVDFTDDLAVWVIFFGLKR